MKTTTMLLIGAAGVAAYFAYKASAPKSMTVTGYGGASKPVKVDANMTDAEIASTTSSWNTAFANSDQAALTSIIGGLSGANHPLAATALTSVLNEATTAAQAASTAGYSAGAMPLRQLRALPSLGHPLDHVHRLAMIGRI